MITCADHLTPIGAAWRDALAGLAVRHPNAVSRCMLTLSSDDVLKVAVDVIADTRDQVTPMRSPFVIACVRLTYFPGPELAHQWFAAAWSGYVQHETLELVTFGGVAVLDPHADPYASIPQNRGLRDGFPPVLTPETLTRALAVCMEYEHAVRLAR